MTLSLVVFILVVIFGIVGNAKAYKLGAFRGWDIWFWNIIWFLALAHTRVPIT